MQAFQENQFLNRWWLLMFIFAVVLILVGTAYYATDDAEENIAVVVSVISVGMTIPIVLGLLYLRLETRIDEKGISTCFSPFTFTRESFDWDEIQKCYIREYNSVKEFGGWGIRGFGRDKKAYHIYGAYGIQIIKKNKTSFLIGTQTPKAAKKAIEKFSATTLSHEV